MAGVCWCREVVLVGIEVLDEWAGLDVVLERFWREPNHDCSDGVFVQDGIEKFANTILLPFEASLDVRQPVNTAFDILKHVIDTLVWVDVRHGALDTDCSTAPHGPLVVPLRVDQIARHRWLAFFLARSGIRYPDGIHSVGGSRPCGHQTEVDMKKLTTRVLTPASWVLRGWLGRPVPGGIWGRSGRFF